MLTSRITYQGHSRYCENCHCRFDRLSNRDLLMPLTTTSGKTYLLIKKAEEVREKEHRLTPSLLLRTLPDIVEFVHAKGLVSMLGGNELPSMISAVLGKPWKSS